MSDSDPYFYQWRCTDTPPGGRRRTHLLRWRMTQDEAIAWAAAHPGSILALFARSGHEFEDPARKCGPRAP